MSFHFEVQKDSRRSKTPRELTTHSTKIATSDDNTVNFTPSTNIIQRVKRRAVNCDKTSAACKTGKRLVSRIGKEFLQVNIKRANNSLAKWGKGMARRLTQRKHTIYKYMQWGLTSWESERWRPRLQRGDTYSYSIDKNNGARRH